MRVLFLICILLLCLFGLLVKPLYCLLLYVFIEVMFPFQFLDWHCLISDLLDLAV